jgi:hypothetical protein
MTVSRHARRLVGFAILLGLLLAPLLALAQVTPGPTSVVPVIRGTAAPLPTPCTDGLVRYDTTAGAWKKCASNAWVSAAGAGTVTSVSGTAPVSVATGTSTPVVSVAAATTGAQGVVQVGTGLSVSSGTVSVAYGTTSGTAAQGNDSRLSDARTPTAHASTHASAGSDPATLAQSQVTGLASALATIPSAASTTPADVGTAAVGTGTTYARADHVHALPDVGAGAGSVGSASQSVTLTTDAKGRVTARSAQSIAIAASQVTSGTMDTARLGSGSASSSTYLRGDSTWATVAGGGSFTRTAVTGATTLAAGRFVLAAITTIGASYTVGLPSSPSEGDVVLLVDEAGTAGSGTYYVKVTPASGSIAMPGGTTTPALTWFKDGGTALLAFNGASWELVAREGVWADIRAVGTPFAIYDFSRGVTLTSGLISAVVNQEGTSARDLAQGTAGSRPAFSGSASIGRGMARFGAAQVLVSSNTTWSTGSVTLLAVAAFDLAVHSTSYRYLFSTGNFTSTTGVGFGLAGGTALDFSTNDFLFFGDGYNSGRAPRYAGQNPYNTFEPFRLAVVGGRAGSTSDIRYNGAVLNATVSGTGSVAGATDTLRVGWNGNAGEYFAGPCGYVALWNQALSDANTRLVERELAYRFVQ